MKKTAGRVAPSERVYEFRIAIRRIQPPVWRRVHVPGVFTLARMHDVIQTVFGWTDTHLHKFSIGRAEYGRPADFDEDILNEAKATLSQALGTRVKRFTYVYDFGDDWVHDVIVEKVISGNSGTEHPVCLAGKRHRPPEDCRGASGYAKFLSVVRDPGHEEHEEMLEWVGGSFDPEAFDLAAVNRALAGLSHGLQLVQ